MRRCVGDENLARHDHDADAAALQGRAHRHLHQPGKLGGHTGQFAVDAALAEQFLRMGLLEVFATDLVARNVRRDRQHRHAAAVGVEQAIDQVQVAWPAAGRAHRELAGKGRLAGRGERGGLLVAYVFPGDCAVPAQRVGESVQGITGDAVHPPDA